MRKAKDSVKIAGSLINGLAKEQIELAVKIATKVQKTSSNRSKKDAALRIIERCNEAIEQGLTTNGVKRVFRMLYRLAV